LASIPQANGAVKHRPAIILRELPGFGDFLVCGVSTQLHQLVEGFDELILPKDMDFPTSGLLASSLIRLGFLAVIPAQDIPGAVGAISEAQHQRLLRRLSEYLVSTAGVV
jgi:mRNA interferase MazF